jgi:hypothetical protein
MPSDSRVDSYRAWRDEMNYPPGDDWSISKNGGAVVEMDGNAAGSRYLRCTLDPRNRDSSVDLSGGRDFALRPPMRTGFGVTLSRRSAMQQFIAGIGGTGSAYAVDTDNQAPVQLSTPVVVASNVATYPTATPHGYSVGDRVSVYDSLDPRVNGLMTVTGIPTTTSFTAALTLANGSYGGSGSAVYIPAALNVADFIGAIADDTTSGNLRFVSRSVGSQRFVRTWNPGATWDSAVVPTGYAARYTYPFQAKHTLEFLHEGDWAGATMHSVDSTAGAMGTISIDQQLPDPAVDYTPRFQWRNLPHLSVPVAITQITKSGSTTATVKAPGHGLNASSWVSIWGVRDQAGFANLSTPTQVASIIDADNFTISFGASVTSTSHGGFVSQTNTSLMTPFAASSSIQSVSPSTTGRTLVQFLATQGSLSIGESVCVIGLVDSGFVRDTAREGLYRVASTDTTLFQVELEPLQGQPIPGSVLTVGGGLVAAPDFRLHYLRGREHGRTAVEIESSRAHGRQMSSVPTFVNGGSVQVSNTVAGNVASIAGSVASANVDVAGTNKMLATFLGAGASVADRAAAAVTSAGSSTTSTAPVGQAIVGAATITGTSGTNPTLDLTLEESYDNGTTWQKVYDLPRITGNGVYLTPPMLVHGRSRWTWPTPGGTTPSFTVALNTMRSSAAPGLVRQLFDRSIAPNTQYSASASLYVEGCSNFGLVVVSNAGATTAPIYFVEFSPDGANWWVSTESVTGTASTTKASAMTCPFAPKYAKIKVYTAGVAAVQSYALLTATS